MSQPSVLRRVPIPQARNDIVPLPLNKQTILSQFLQITTQMFCLSGEQQQIFEDYCEIKGGRIGIHIDEEKDKDIAFIIGFVGDQNSDGILFFQPNLSCVLKNTDACVGKTLNLQRNVGNHTCLNLQLEKKRKGFLEVGEFVIQLSLETILKHTIPTSAIPEV